MYYRKPNGGMQKCIEYAKEHSRMGEWLAQGPANSVEVARVQESYEAKLKLDGLAGLPEKLHDKVPLAVIKTKQKKVFKGQPIQLKQKV